MMPGSRDTRGGSHGLASACSGDSFYVPVHGASACDGYHAHASSTSCGDSSSEFSSPYVDTGPHKEGDVYQIEPFSTQQSISNPFEPFATGESQMPSTRENSP